MLRRINRRGGPRRFRAKWSVYYLLGWVVILTFLSFSYQHLTAEWKIASASEDLDQMRFAGAPVQNLQEENQALKEKLERSSKVTTTETTRELVRYYIHKYFPQSEWANAEAIAKCESGLNPQSLNDKNTNGSADRGVWQINTVHAKRFQTMYAINWELGAHDIDMATRYAKFLYDHSGWSPWVCRKVLS